MPECCEIKRFRSFIYVLRSTHFFLEEFFFSILFACVGAWVLYFNNFSSSRIPSFLNLFDWNVETPFIENISSFIGVYVKEIQKINIRAYFGINSVFTFILNFWIFSWIFTRPWVNSSNISNPKFYIQTVKLSNFDKKITTVCMVYIFPKKNWLWTY